ncbi:MAG TPA: TIGR03086 family metal-binding protein [Actinomycetota bacterium]|nr:TIGR03086 family metal-binding protein [Actinomycetota bacterium]
MIEPKELHRRALEGFGRHVHAVKDDQWGDPTPCSEWDVRTLVHHLVSENLWMPPLLEGRTISQVGDALQGDLLGDDPKAAWDRSMAEAGQAIRAVPLDRTVHLSYGDVPAEHYISESFADLIIHGWDLARAIGADEAMDPEVVDLLYERYKPIEDRLKATGLFGPKVDPPPGADKQTMLLAVFGRVA